MSKPPTELQSHKNGIEKMKRDDLLVQIIREVHNEGVVGEDDTIIALTLKVMLRLVKNANPTSSNVLVSDMSGGGKDYIVKCICSVLLRKNAYFHRSRLTETVFTYWHAKDKGFTWDGKVIHLEDPDPEFLNSQSFKVRASGETEETVIKKQKAMDVKVEGKPVIIVTSLNATIDTEGGRRWDSCRIDTSEYLTAAIVKRSMLLHCGLITINKDSELREALQNLQPKSVVIPYAEAMIDVLPHTIPMRTQHLKLLDYIKASAVLHQYQRETDDNGNIIANIFDYEYARFCFTKFGNMQGTPLNIAERKLLDLLQTNSRPMTINQILPNIDRGQSWLYEKIDRLKELGLIKELFIMDDELRKEVKHLMAISSSTYSMLANGEEIKGNSRKLSASAGGFPVDSQQEEIPSFLGGFPAFVRIVYILINESESESYSRTDSLLKTLYNFNILEYPPKKSKQQSKPNSNSTLEDPTKKTANNGSKVDSSKLLESTGKTPPKVKKKPSRSKADTFKENKKQGDFKIKKGHNQFKSNYRTKLEKGKALDKQKSLSSKVNDVRDYITENKQSGYKIDHSMLIYKFGTVFINVLIDKGVLIKNGDEYICT